MKTHSRGKKSAFNRLSVLLRQGKIKTLRCVITGRGQNPRVKKPTQRTLPGTDASRQENSTERLLLSFQSPTFREPYEHIISTGAPHTPRSR